MFLVSSPARTLQPIWDCRFQPRAARLQRSAQLPASGLHGVQHAKPVLRCGCRDLQNTKELCIQLVSRQLLSSSSSGLSKSLSSSLESRLVYRWRVFRHWPNKLVPPGKGSTHIYIYIPLAGLIDEKAHMLHSCKLQAVQSFSIPRAPTSSSEGG